MAESSKMGETELLTVIGFYEYFKKDHQNRLLVFFYEYFCSN